MVQKDAEQEREMRAEIHEMKKEQSTISMMDEFARHARLERKINKMTDKLKTHGRRPVWFPRFYSDVPLYRWDNKIAVADIAILAVIKQR